MAVTLSLLGLGMLCMQKVCAKRGRSGSNKAAFAVCCLLPPQRRDLRPVQRALAASPEWEQGLIVDPDVQQVGGHYFSIFSVIFSIFGILSFVSPHWLWL